MLQFEQIDWRLTKTRLVFHIIWLRDVVCSLFVVFCARRTCCIEDVLSDGNLINTPGKVQENAVINTAHKRGNSARCVFIFLEGASSVATYWELRNHLNEAYKHVLLAYFVVMN